MNFVQRRRPSPRFLIATAGMVVAIGAASSAQAQSSWAAAVSDSWFNPARWAPAGIPNSAGTNVTLGLAGAYTVSMQNASATCGTLTVSNPSGVLSLVDNSALFVNGNVSNSGLIQISTPGSPGNGTHFDAAQPVTMSGTGTLRLAATTSNGDSDSAYLYHNGNGANTLTNSAGHTIAGYGRIYTSIINNGLVNADQNGKGLLMINQPKTNNASITASNGGFVQFRSIGLSQGSSGVCTSSNNSPIQFVSASVWGGTLNGAGTNSGTQFFSSNNADSLTLQNLTQVTDNSGVLLGAGGVINNGTWTVSDPAAPGNASHIDSTAPSVTIGGTGTLRLQGPSSGNGDNNAAYLYHNANGANTLTNGSSHSIKGYGRIFVNLINNGSVNADVANKGLFFIEQPKTNNGTMTASNGGFLQFRSVTVTGNPAAQIISTDAASPVQMVSSTMTGGGFTTSGSGVFQYFGANTLSNLTVNGLHQITDNSSAHMATNLVNNGTWTISDPAAAGNASHLDADAPVSISGTGSIVLQGPASGYGDSNAAYLYHNGNGANSLTLGANQTVSGYGRIFANIINNGTINANNTPNTGGPPNKGLYFIEQPKTNNATITSSNGGFWYLRGITLTNNGLLSSSNTGISGGGLESCTVNGGTIANVSNQAFGTAGAVSINGSTLTAGSVIQINDNSSVHTSTGITNNGTILISTPTAPGNGTHLDADAPVTISGGGLIRLQGVSSGNGDNDSAYLYNNANGLNTLTNAATHSIKGYGRIYTNVINNGTINADVSGKGLIFWSQPKTNNATITSSNGGFWYLRGITLTNPGLLSSTNTTASGGGFENCTVAGGTLTNISNQVFGTVGAVTLDGVNITNGSVVQVNDNSSLVPGPSGIANNGTILVQNIGGAGNGTRIIANAPTAISGTGTVRLQATGFANDSAYLYGLGGALTLGPGQTLTGTGRMYGNIVTQGRIAMDQPFGTPTTLGNIQALSGSLTMAATSNFDVQIGSATSYDSISGTDTIAQAGALTVTTTGGYVPAASHMFTIVSGNSLTGTFSPVTLPATGSFGPAHVVYGPTTTKIVMCYANCDGSTTAPALNVLDFSCFINAFAAGEPYANCDASTTPPVLNVLDFACFLNKFSAGCP